MTGPAAALRHVAWIAPEAMAMLAQVDDREHQLMVLPPSFLAGSIARVGQLGPVLGAGQRDPREADPVLLGDLVHPDEMRRRSAFAVLEVDLAWIMAAEGSVGQHRLAVIRDTGGWWLAGPAARSRS